MASKKSKTTFAKMARDRELKERRELKREKKKAAKIAKALGVSPPPPQPVDPEEGPRAGTPVRREASEARRGGLVAVAGAFSVPEKL